MNQEVDLPVDDQGTWHPSLPEHDSGQQRFDPKAMPESQPSPDGGAVSPDGRAGKRVGAWTKKVSQARPRDDAKQGDAAQPTSGSDEPIEEGRVVFNKYHLLEKIGEGGMGEVWRVWHVDLESERALKLIKPEISQSDKGGKRFKREAQLMAKINHPNAVAVHDFKHTPSVDYIEMEFVHGRSLTDIIKQHNNQPMPLEWTAQVLDQLCSVLQEAHGHVDEKTGKPKPIIHRDLKPSNLMLVDREDASEPPKLKVLDFGIAKMVEDDSNPELTGLTAVGDLLGTPAYMSPEQIQGGLERGNEKHELDGRSDLYSTGVVLYHLLTGKLPFQGNKKTMLAAHLYIAPPPMNQANPKAKVPPNIERLVRQCLAKNPKQRPQSAKELRERFQNALDLAKPPMFLSLTSESQRKFLNAVYSVKRLFHFFLSRQDESARSDHGSSKDKDTQSSPETPTICFPNQEEKSSIIQPTSSGKNAVASAAISPRVPEEAVAQEHEPISLDIGNCAKAEQVRFAQIWMSAKEMQEGFAKRSNLDVERINDLGLRFRLIPPGTFYLGAARQDRAAMSHEKPRVPVTIGHPFYAATFPLSVSLVRRFLDDAVREGHPTLMAMFRDRSFATDSKEQDPNRRLAEEAPAVQVSAADAEVISEWMGRRDRCRYRLPTEAEWEYMARAGVEGVYCWPPGADPRQYAVFAAPGPISPDPKRANAWGLIDTLGNVAEWTSSAYAPLETGAATRIAAPDVTTRVIRGGSWQDRRIEHLRLSRRCSMLIHARKNYLGARVICEVEGAPADMPS